MVMRMVFGRDVFECVLVFVCEFVMLEGVDVEKNLVFIVVGELMWFLE